MSKADSRASFRAQIVKLRLDAEELTNEFIARREKLVQKHKAEVAELEQANAKELKALASQIREFLQHTKSKDARKQKMLKFVFEHKIEEALEEAVKKVCQNRAEDIQALRDEAISQPVLEQLARVANSQLEL